MARPLDTLGIAFVTLLAASAAPASAASLAGRVAVRSELLDLSIQRPDTGAGPTLSDDFSVTPGPNAVGTGNSSAAYEASFGQLRGRASLQTLAPGTLPFGFDFDGGANGEASWADVVTIQAPGLAGQSGTFRIRLDLSGSVEGQAAGQDSGFESFVESSWLVNLGAGTGTGGFQQRFGGCRANASRGGGCVDYGDPLGLWESEDIAFVYGSAFDLQVALFATVFARTVEGGSTLGRAQLHDTVTWQGFFDLKDANGASVAAYGVTSQSGTDWSVAVPEPGSAILLGAGLAALARRGRCRPHRTA